MIVVKSKLLSRGSSVSVQVLMAPCPSNGSHRSSRRFTSNSPASCCPVLVTIVCGPGRPAGRGRDPGEEFAVGRLRLVVLACRLRADHGAVERECRVHARVRPGHARDRDGDRPQPAQVVPGVVVFEEGLVELDRAGTGLAELDQRGGSGQDQRDVLGQLQFPRVVRDVAGLHPPQVEEQAFACGEAPGAGCPSSRTG